MRTKSVCGLKNRAVKRFVISRAVAKQTYKETSGGAMAKDAHAREVRFYTQYDGRVFLHPASTNFAVGRFESPWLVYSKKVKTSKVSRSDQNQKTTKIFFSIYSTVLLF